MMFYLYVHHLNALYTDFEIRFEDVLNMVMLQLIINSNGDIDEKDVSLQEDLVKISTSEELKVFLRNGYWLFLHQKDIPVGYSAPRNIVIKYFIGYLHKIYFSNFLKKFEKNCKRDDKKRLQSNKN